MDEYAIYQIRVRGQLDEHWMRWFEGYSLKIHPNGDCNIMAVSIVQSALYSLRNRIRDLGLELISGQRYETINDLPKE